MCEVQLQKQGQSDIRASDSGPNPSENDEHRAAHQEGGKTLWSEKFNILLAKLLSAHILLLMEYPFGQ